MDIKIALDDGISRENDTAAPAGSGTARKTGEADFVIDDSQELLLKAQKDAELAKAVARQAISRAFQQSEATVKRAEALARVFDDALQGSFSQINQDEKDSGAPGRMKKPLNNGQHPLSVISDVTKSLFINKAVGSWLTTWSISRSRKKSKKPSRRPNRTVSPRSWRSSRSRMKSLKPGRKLPGLKTRLKNPGGTPKRPSISPGVGWKMPSAKSPPKRRPPG
jgi:hypothetical protein